MRAVQRFALKSKIMAVTYLADRVFAPEEQHVYSTLGLPAVSLRKERHVAGVYIALRWSALFR